MTFRVNRGDVYDQLRSDADRLVESLRPSLPEDELEAQEDKYSSEIDRLLEAFFYVQDGANWSHADLENPGDSFDDFCFGPETNLLADFYFSEAKLKSKMLDWYLVDGLIASVFNRIRDELGRIAMPKLHKLGTVSRQRMFWLTGWYFISFVFKWVVLLAIIGSTFAMGLEHSGWLVASASIVLFLIYNRVSKRKAMASAVKDYTDRLMMVKRVYALTSTSNIDWQVLQKELEDTRSRGIEWPSSLYSAIRSRTATPQVERGQVVLTS